MKPIFESLPFNLGDYTVLALVGVHEASDFYVAIHKQVGRNVVIEVLRPEQSVLSPEDFVRITRARASLEMMYLMPVFEFRKEGAYLFAAQEMPKGKSLAQFIEQGEKLSPRQIAQVIYQAALVYSNCREARYRSMSFTADMIFVSRNPNMVSFISPVRQRSAILPADAESMSQLGSILKQVLPQHIHGEKDAALLVDMLLDSSSAKLNSWDDVVYVALNLIDFIDENSITRPSLMIHHGESKKKRFIWFALLFSTLSIGLGLLMGYLCSDEKPVAKPIKGNSYERVKLNGDVVELLRAPVSGEQFASFLSSFEKLSEAEKKSLLQGLPADAQKILSDSLQDIVAIRAADEVLVSHSEAVAYARFNGGQLPQASVLKAYQKKFDSKRIEEWVSDTQVDLFERRCYYSLSPQFELHAALPSLYEVQRRAFRVIRKKP